MTIQYRFLLYIYKKRLPIVEKHCVYRKCRKCAIFYNNKKKKRQPRRSCDLFWIQVIPILQDCAAMIKDTSLNKRLLLCQNFTSSLVGTSMRLRHEEKVSWEISTVCLNNHSFFNGWKTEIQRKSRKNIKIIVNTFTSLPL